MNDFGIIGIGRIGTSMARNMSSKGIIVSLYDKSHNSLAKLKSDYPELESSLVFDDIYKCTIIRIFNYIKLRSKQC